MKRLWIYLRDYRLEGVLGPLFKLLEASFELFVPLVIAAIIDRGIGTGDAGMIVRWTLLLVALGLVGLICSVTAQYFAAKASVGFVKKVRHALFAHIQTLSDAELDQIGSSTLITRMTSDCNQVQSGLNLTLRLLLRSPFVVFGAMIMAFTIDVPSALIFAVAIPVLSVVVFGIMLLCMPLYKKVQQRLDGVLGITRENLTGVRVIRAFCKEEEEIASFEQRNQALTASSLLVGRISALMNPLTYVIINLAIVALIHTGALRVDSGILTQGQVIALYNYMSQILVELIKLANLIISITKALACANRISAVFDVHSSLDWKDVSAASKVGAPAVAFDHVSLRYPGAGANSLTDIDFSVMPGQTVGVIGGTGSGKSSLVNLIGRFYEVSEGSVRVDGVDVRDMRRDDLIGEIGIVPQKAVLFKGSIRENLLWGKKDATDDELDAALRVAQAREIVDGKEGGLEHLIEQNGRNLSGGQRQRLTIARALVRQPKILILDDSASALDFATDAALRKSIRELDPQPTVFIVSQRTSSIQYADLILVLDDGRLVGKGTHDELLESCEVYREIYDSQFKKEEKQA